MKKVIVQISLFLLGSTMFAGVVFAETIIKKPLLINPDLLDIRDDLTLINPDDQTADSEFFHYKEPSTREIELLKDPYLFEPYLNLVPDAVKILLLKKMEKDESLTANDLAKIPVEIREQVMEEVIRELSERQDEENVPAEPIEQAQPTESNSIESFFSEYWVQFLALVVSVVGLLLAVTGFSMAASKKRKSISRLMNEIDDTFAAFKWKSKRCEAELYRLHDIVDDKLKKGKIDESSYQVLINRIDKYLTEINDPEMGKLRDDVEKSDGSAKE